jgi:trehalose/maltose hydrolase-like predicted phosphorylase
MHGAGERGTDNSKQLGHVVGRFADYYLRTARLDLDDGNGNANQGVHIACMAGTWMSIVNGFAGMRMSEGKLSFDPRLPRQWKRLAFKLRFRGRVLFVDLAPGRIGFSLKGAPLVLTVGGRDVPLKDGQRATVTH